MDMLTTIFSIIILITSVMFHELAHGIVADRLGDPTPSLAGRLTLNPLAHLEWVGSFLVPLLCVVTGTGFIIGWAKPVPFNPRFFSCPRIGPALVAAAGPLTNAVIAIIFSVAFKLSVGVALNGAFSHMIATVIIINVSLAVFNLMPIPPLDGHHIIGALVPAYRIWSERVMIRYGMIVMMIAILVASSCIAPIVSFFIRILLQ